MTVAAGPVADLPVGQSLVGGPVGSRRYDAQHLQQELQGVVGRGGGQADTGHLLRRLDGQNALPHTLWIPGRERKRERETFET